MNEEYLADGLYVSYDGWQLCLRAPRLEGDHVVYLDPETWEMLLAYVDRLRHPAPGQTPPAPLESPAHHSKP
jgi:hypothetical protein